MPKATIDRFEQRKLTRAKLVDAALQLFSTSGYEHATVDDISAAAGYSKGAYYFHFSTKDDILLELLRMWTEDRSAIIGGLEGSPAPGDGLRETLAEFFSYADAPRWPGVLLEFWAQALRNQEVSRRLSQAYAGWRKQLAEGFHQAIAGSEMSLESADDAAAVTLAAHDGYAVQTAIGTPGGKALTPEQLTDALLTSIQTATETARRAVAR
jgi:AcrR family transcriptional regulator